MKAMVVVAHPDDCLIFAYSLIRKYPQHDWSITYLTYSRGDARAEEFAHFWARRNVPTNFLGFVDNYHDNENKTISFNEQIAEQAVIRAIKDQDFIVTHDESGDYGHVHHVLVNQIITKNHPHVITFKGPAQGNECISIDTVDYTAEEFPQHADVVMQFHKNEHKNEYHVPGSVRAMIERI